MAYRQRDQGESSEPRNVVIALDGSKHSKHAFTWFMKNVYRKSDNVVLTHCAEEFQVQPTDFLGANEIMIDELYQKHKEKSKLVANNIESWAKEYQVPHKLEKLRGHPGHSIVRVAEDNNANMIICGSRGQGIIRRTILGSISDYILHHARMPVVICKHEDEQAKLAPPPS